MARKNFATQYSQKEGRVKKAYNYNQRKALHEGERTRTSACYKHSWNNVVRARQLNVSTDGAINRSGILLRHGDGVEWIKMRGMMLLHVHSTELEQYRASRLSLQAKNREQHGSKKLKQEEPIEYSLRVHRGTAFK